MWGGDVYYYLSSEKINDRIFIHLLLSALCVVSFGFDYAIIHIVKPFWFELKEILRTLLIFSVIELAVLAFSKLYSSRYLWISTWTIALVIVPLERIFIIEELGIPI